MITVHKYTLPIDDVVEICTHVGAELLHVAVQYSNPVLWVRVDTEAPAQARRLRIAGTGHRDARGDYVGTFMSGDGQLVFHVFDLGPVR